MPSHRTRAPITKNTKMCMLVPLKCQQLKQSRAEARLIQGVFAPEDVRLCWFSKLQKHLCQPTKSIKNLRLRIWRVEFSPEDPRWLRYVRDENSSLRVCNGETPVCRRAVEWKEKMKRLVEVASD
ncbi:hypothetical protein RUM44_013662 [Polyplax serrata]|uniref:Uncharacterized protein n=1 Tax=Polyplax serrata TaxID=468196 RepID=A0ABR1BIF9_POLSC